jgi:hypothetical protein
MLKDSYCFRQKFGWEFDILCRSKEVLKFEPTFDKEENQQLSNDTNESPPTSFIFFEIKDSINYLKSLKSIYFLKGYCHEIVVFSQGLTVLG